jgi:tRNA uridine 5-carboxymethylaminomethyl modification enzyme
MFTSRAEHRLVLRQDNADLRLTPRAIALGLAGPERTREFEAKSARREELLARLPGLRCEGIPLSLWLKRPENTFESLPQDLRGEYPDALWDALETDLKYEGYIRRQEEQIERARRSESREIPAVLDYKQVVGLRREAAEKLARIRPVTLGQASRISGVTPADLSLLAVWLARGITSAGIPREPAEPPSASAD